MPKRTSKKRPIDINLLAASIRAEKILMEWKGDGAVRWGWKMQPVMTRPGAGGKSVRKRKEIAKKAAEAR